MLAAVMDTATPAASDRPGWQLNPTLTVLAYFLAPVAGEDARRTRLPLAAHPDVAAWLLTVLDHLVAGKPIGEPPGGAAREALVRGAVILVDRRPDGGVALRLNPGFDLRLEINARRARLPAANTQIALGQDPELARWLLEASLGGGFRPARAPTPAVLAGLRACAGIVQEAVPPPAYFPDPDAPADPAAELACLDRVTVQQAGAPIPADVRRVLGRHTPALPPGFDFAWGFDAGTGLVYPVRLPAGTTTASVPAAGQEATTRAAEWSSRRDSARSSMQGRGFALLREVIPPAQRSALRRYVRQLRERGYFPDLNDGQVRLRASIHNEPTIAALHNGLAGLVNTIGPEPVLPSYSFLSCYEEGAVLDRHLDRPQCRYNICFVLDMEYTDGTAGEPEPWPIYLELEGRPVEALMRVGDGVFFSGSNIWHWRDALPPGRRVVVCFSHYVPADHAGSLD